MDEAKLQQIEAAYATAKGVTRYGGSAEDFATLAAWLPPLVAEVRRLQAIETAARRIEWIVQPQTGGMRYCPECDEYQGTGHATDCAFGAALAEQPR